MNVKVNEIGSSMRLMTYEKEGMGRACMRRCIAAVPIAVSAAIGLQAVGICAYTQVAQLGNVLPQ